MIRRFLIVLLCCAAGLQAGRVISSAYASPLLGISVSYVVVLPNSYDQDTAGGKRFPVLYLLHCAGCDDQTWVQSGTGDVDAFIDSVGFIAVAPYDGGRFGWWLDSPKLTSYAHSRFLVEEFKPLIDSHYATLPDRGNTGAAGWSMGGFGALHNLIRHPDVFGAAFSIKGGVDPTLPLNPHWGSDFGLYADLGSALSDTANWNAVNILKNAWRLKGSGAAIGFYGGRNDVWFAEENRRLDTIMTGEGITHLFYETDEDHYGVPDQRMRRIMDFFDSVFTHVPARSFPIVKIRAVPPRPAAGAVAADILGRELRGRGADAPGLRIIPPAAPAGRPRCVIAQ